MPNMALRTSLTAPKDMLTEYMRIRNITARMIKIPVPSTTQPIVEVEALFVVIVFPDLIGLPLRIYKIENDLSRCRPTACVTGGWGETTHETGICHSSEKAPKNAQSPSRPVHAVLGAVPSSCSVHNFSN